MASSDFYTVFSGKNKKEVLKKIVYWQDEWTLAKKVVEEKS